MLLVRKVLLPYEITLLSNEVLKMIKIQDVLLPYEITLLSNCLSSQRYKPKFYYLMKLHYSQTSNENKLHTLHYAGHFIR